jgi:hypothetical protein
MEKHRETIYKLEANRRIYSEVLDLIAKNVSDLELRHHIINETDIVVEQSNTWSELLHLINTQASFEKIEMYCREQASKLEKDINKLKKI